MFVEESAWLRDHLASLPLASAARVLDIGSQSIEFRTVRQPWIERNIHAPIRDRGAAIVNVDLRDAPGIDVVADVTDPGFDAAAVGVFDLVLCCNLLEHVTDRETTLRNVRQLVGHRGYLAVTVPGHFPYHADPIDTMYRPSPRQLVSDVNAIDSEMQVIGRGSVGCLDRAYYLSRKSRVRRWVPPLRWRTSCALLQRR